MRVAKVHCQTNPDVTISDQRTLPNKSAGHRSDMGESRANEKHDKQKNYIIICSEQS